MLEQEYQQFSHVQQELSELKELVWCIGSREPEPVKKELQRMMKWTRNKIASHLKRGGVICFLEAQDKAN